MESWYVSMPFALKKYVTPPPLKNEMVLRELCHATKPLLTIVERSFVNEFVIKLFIDNDIVILSKNVVVLQLCDQYKNQWSVT